MYAKFEALEKEKRERILNAAIAEFSAKGYDHASTNAIVESAGIAKGLLFHYFRSKKHLFLYLCDYCVDRVTSEVYASAAMGEADFFAKMRLGEKAKLALLRRYPEMLAFTKRAYLEESPAIKPEVEKRNRGFVAATTARFFGNLDHSKFKDGLDIPAALNVMLWSLEACSNQYMAQLQRTGRPFDLDEAEQNAERYLKLFEQSFYKQG